MGISASQFVNEELAEFQRNPKGGSKYFEYFGEGKSDAAHCCKGISYMYTILGALVNGSNTVTLRSAILALGGQIIANCWSDKARLGDVLLMHWDDTTDLHSVLNHACVFELEVSSTVIQTLDFNGNAARENKRFLRYKRHVAYIIRFPYVDNETTPDDFTGWAWNAAHTLCYYKENGKYITDCWREGTGPWAGRWYYVGPKAYFVCNEWHQGSGQFAGKYYYCGAEGYAVMNQWVKTNGAWYYCGADGASVTGWQYIDGSWYHFDDAGVCEYNCIRKGTNGYYYLGKDGKVQTTGTVTLKVNKDGSLEL